MKTPTLQTLTPANQRKYAAKVQEFIETESDQQAIADYMELTLEDMVSEQQFASFSREARLRIYSYWATGQGLCELDQRAAAVL